MSGTVIQGRNYLTVAPASHFTPSPGTSWPVAVDDPHYRCPGGVYAPFKFLYRPHSAQTPDNAALPGRMQARWFRHKIPQGVFPAQEIDSHYLAGRSRSPNPLGTVVRISGLGSNVMVDEDLDEMLLDHFNVITIDLIGTGLSSWVKNFEGRSFSPKDYEATPQVGVLPKSVQATLEIARPQIAILNHQLEAWGETGPVFGFAHSMGAMILMSMLTEHEVFPETMHGVVSVLLANTYASDGKIYETPAYVRTMGRVFNLHDIHGLPKSLATLASGLGAFGVMGYFARDKSLSLLTNIVSRAMFTHMPRDGVNEDFLKSRIDAQTVMARIIHDALTDPDASRAIYELQTGIPVPLRIFLSGHDPLMIPGRIKAALESSIPDVRVTMFPEAGHLLPQEDAGTVANGVLDLARSISGRR